MLSLISSRHEATPVRERSVVQRLRLAGTGELRRSRRGRDLTRVTNTSVTYGRRPCAPHTYAADKVVLIGNGCGGGTCGSLAHGRNNVFASHAFTVVDRTCATAGSFGHELGHGVGLSRA
jgi:hypothetical protein